ncbi:tail fiber assembly protein [Halodesulfovibrio aestuarii]|uniref:Tail fiber assembly protein n=1 Tax=Halodesulfovibrio aestuarii TaxID=126333 RepID=A0ABV4JR61_9BACT
MYKVKVVNGKPKAFVPEIAPADAIVEVEKKIWEENCQNNDNKIIDNKFVPHHIPDRTYWLAGKEYVLKHPDVLPEGASFEKPSDISAQEERVLRDELLRLSDWAVLPDAPLTLEQKQEWQAYRQALRDIPQQSGFPEFVIVPEAPKKVVGQQ